MGVITLDEKTCRVVHKHDVTRGRVAAADETVGERVRAAIFVVVARVDSAAGRRLPVERLLEGLARVVRTQISANSCREKNNET